MFVKKKLKLAFALTLVSVSLLISLNAPAQQGNRKPNIVIVVVDDIGSAWLPPYAKKIQANQVEQVIIDEYKKTKSHNGQFSIENHLEAARNSMPFVGQLAAKGTVFNNAFNIASLCAPSRAGLLTSRYPQSWGAYTLSEVEKFGIPQTIHLLPEIFQKAGYLTGAIGKWHVGPNDPAKKEMLDTEHFRSSSAPGYGPLDRGFSYFYGYNYSQSKYDASPNLWENNEPVKTLPQGDFLTDVLSQKAKAFVEKAVSQKKSFLLYFAPMTLHGGITPPPQKYQSKFNTGVAFTDEYAGHLLALDEGIKGIYAVLEKAGEVDNTFFVLCSDNGSPYIVPPYNAPFKGGKGSGWLGGSHSPLIMVMPGKTKAIYNDDLVSPIDIFPTALDVAGLPVPQGIDGISLKGTIYGGTQTQKHDMLFSAGLNSARWSFNYYTGEQAKAMDNDDCPVYLWGIDNSMFYLHITPLKPGLYPAKPDGAPAVVQLFNYRNDPLSKIPLPLTDDHGLLKKSTDWLINQQEPLKDRKTAYKGLSTNK